jgi:hypothetical protein
MASAKAVTSIATILTWLAGSSCQDVLGGIDVVPAPQSAVPVPPATGVSPGTSGNPSVPPFGGPLPFPAGVMPGAPLPRLDAGMTLADAGALDAAVDAAPDLTPLPPRPIVVGDLVAELTRVGVDEGGPRRGSCAGGIITGVRPTANPREEVFGQRLTFIEPICARVSHVPAAGLAEPARALITLVRDDAIVNWDAGDFLGIPPTEEPDPRVTFVVQPETFCPEGAPVLVGLSGRYDPIAPDSTTTAAFRSLVIECAPLVVADNGVDVVASDAGHQLIAQVDSFPGGEAAYASACVGGSVLTAMVIHAGFWLDGFELGCSSLRSPRLPGEPCLAERDCQSGACAPEGACAP